MTLLSTIVLSLIPLKDIVSSLYHFLKPAYSHSRMHHIFLFILVIFHHSINELPYFFNITLVPRFVVHTIDVN